VLAATLRTMRAADNYVTRLPDEHRKMFVDAVR